VTQDRLTVAQEGCSAQAAAHGEPLVSVVMSVFNGEAFLREAVESILSQSFRDFEFITIDDGSTDGTGSILDWYAARDSRVRIYHQPKRGLAYSLNRGCALARGKYIARMDADDVSVRHRLLWQVQLMEAHPELGAAGGWVELIDIQGRVFELARHPVDHRSIVSDLYLPSCPVVHPTAVMRKSVLLATGGYREPFLDAEDYDLWLRFAERSQLANLDRVVLKYRRHPGQVSCRKLRQQCLSTLAAREIAFSGGIKSPEALRSASAIGPADLAKLGVSAAAQQQYFALRYCSSICTLARQGQTSAALSLATDMLGSSQWEHAERWVIAQVWLTTAWLYWRRGMHFRSLLAIGRAIMTRPLVAGRPLKSVLRRLVIRIGQTDGARFDDLA
jgi:hypothetical protein